MGPVFLLFSRRLFARIPLERYQEMREAQRYQGTLSAGMIGTKSGFGVKYTTTYVR